MGMFVSHRVLFYKTLAHRAPYTLFPASDCAISFSSRCFRVSSFLALTTHQIRVWRYDAG